MRSKGSWKLVVGGVAVVAAVIVGAGIFSKPGAAGPAVTVYKTPTCGCCDTWVGHLRANGFDVDAKNVTDSRLLALKGSYGLDRRLYSCHTAVVDGYVVEGHVPADVILRLLEERPEIVGLAVPGMPVGSPGMEGPNPQPYDIVSIDREGRMQVYDHRE